MEAIKEVIVMLQDFIKRALVPSVSFGFIFIVEYIFFKNKIDCKVIEWVDEIIDFIEFDVITTIIFVVSFVGLSYFLSILNQLIYDNFLKKNFNVFPFYDDKLLSSLRIKVIEKLQHKLEFIDKENTDCSIYKTDYFLYQAVGRELMYAEKSTKTFRYVDDAKSIGIFFTSLIIVNLLVLNWWYLWIVFPIYFIGYLAIKSKYRSRAIRIYINYLLSYTINIRRIWR